MKKPEFGLAFGGGGARGLAHIQAIRAFEDLGLHPSVISGTSIGAVSAALFAAGYTSEDIVALTRSVVNNRLRLFADFLLAEPSPTLARFDLDMFRFGEIDLERALSVVLPSDFPKTFEDLPTPIYVVATNYYKQKETVFSSGPLIPALAASAAVPAVFLPVIKDDQIYIDGSATNPVPFDIISDKADIIAGVSVIGVSKGKPKTRPRKVDVLTSSNYIMQQAILENKEKQYHPDIVIRSKISGIKAADFTKFEKILDRSEQIRTELRTRLAESIENYQP